MKRLSKTKIKWSPEFAYAIGLITTDGNLSSDGRHINLTSKDRELINIFKKCLNLKNKVGRKARGYSKNKKYFVIQFGDKNFYEFLLTIGLCQAKSKTIKQVIVPDKYFADFFRGCIDGDGNINTSYHPESRHIQLRIRLFSASPDFLKWIKQEITDQFKIYRGWFGRTNGIYSLNYAKEDAIKLFQFMYYNKNVYCLGRKYKIAKNFLRA